MPMLATRLRNQRLTRTTFTRPEQVVAWLGAVQAQDYTGAVWGLALRARALTAGAIDRAFDEGRLLRTHVLRPTWHFVLPEDIRWMQALTGPRVRRLLATYDSRLEIDTRLMTRARRIIEAALDGGRALTRAELAAELARRGRIVAAGQRLAHIVMHLDLDPVICSGPRRGKHFTYALVAERAPNARTLKRDEAIAELSRRYFQSHGPATVRDFAWWSGLTMAEARIGAAAAPDDLLLHEPPGRGEVAGADYLLPNYDEYLIAYKDRGAVIDDARVRNLGIFTSLEYPHQVVLGGRVAGSWRRAIGAASASVTVKLYRRPSARERAALSQQADRYGRMLGLRCALES